ncbi:cytochrome b/b6 domain-containing protein [Vibrio sp. SS-MA-C1-2]|uniref:cytochrome b/b6 domain-containing protein n=1 Tax=Vibrio sp. SS-MA-C1-2 TaxID=2908646 RepID=UPI001F24F97F|nr:cytochrome b/b6 domain-containing protein [Vibrio sp. SS-MA-C1-2]UJF17017.1 cytochrome b/b6 domain-containing protein [Vibrio sp. SS-MA-C1-2]
MHYLKLAIKDVFSSLPNNEKILHGFTLAWVLFQILSSGLMHVSHHGRWDNISTLDLIHIYSGILLLPLSLIFMTIVIKRRKFNDLFPWVFKDFHQLRLDLMLLKQRKLPPAHPKGLAAIVEGLGILALLMALLTGLLWFITIKAGSDASLLLSIHKSSVGLIETYFYAHGFMGLLHIFFAWKKVKN